jgi:hypothetical protein
MRQINVNVSSRDEFNERLDLYIYLLDLCQNVNHAQKVYNSWLEWCDTQKKAY